ncbi:fumarylacetoacetate hydrolase family protein [Rhodanobacter sp. BL-MT-08]
MRLLRYSIEGNAPRTAIEKDRLFYDLNQLSNRFPTDMLGLLEKLPSLKSDIEAKTDALNPDSALPLGIMVLCPIEKPGKILCLGLNYDSHASEAGHQVPLYPDIFAKFSNTLIGDGANIVMPRQSVELDYEAELCVVIGKKCRNVTADNALSVVAGYTIMNDVSVRDMQLRSTQATMGKNFDTHGPCGPVIVTSDEIPDPQSLSIELSVNGEIRQRGRTSEMIFSVSDIITFLTSEMTLEPGDLISTGTPAGTGSRSKPPKWLRPGDEVVVDLSSIGRLRNTVISFDGLHDG